MSGEEVLTFLVSVSFETILIGLTCWFLLVILRGIIRLFHTDWTRPDAD